MYPKPVLYGYTYSHPPLDLIYLSSYSKAAAAKMVCSDLRQRFQSNPALIRSKIKNFYRTNPMKLMPNKTLKTPS